MHVSANCTNTSRWYEMTHFILLIIHIVIITQVYV